MKLLPLLLLVGCATYPYNELSYDDLYRQASECISAKAIGCDPLWDEINRRDEVRERREERNKTIECPKNRIIYKDRWGTMYCITRENARNIFSGRRY